MQRRWISAGEIDDLAPGTALVLRHEGGQIALFRLADGELRAVDNRCPHEGYPLVQGTISGRVLTCCHHNFKFDLDTGRCTLGEEAVAVCPVRVEDGAVFVDATRPDPAAEIAARSASLHAAVYEGRVGQIAREVVRLLSLGASPAQIASDAASWDADRSEYGSTHALPVAADAVRLARDLPGLSAALALVPAYELASEESRRRPAREPVAPEDPPEALTEALRAAIEGEDAERAEALLRGAVRRLGWASLEGPLLQIASDHLSDYGHGMIYTVKTFELLRACDASAESILVGLGRALVFATRDDLAPPYAPLRRQLMSLGDLPGESLGNTGVLPDREQTVRDLLAAPPSAAVEIVISALRGGIAPAELLAVLAIASAERLLRFDPSVDRDLHVQDGWLDATHLLTLAEALRVAFERAPHGDLVRGLLHLARLVSATAPLTAEIPSPAPAALGPSDLCAAVAAQQPERAVAIALGLDVREAIGPLMRLVLDDIVVRPIFHAHAIKLPLAAADLSVALSDRRPFAAAVRFLASPRSERRTAMRVYEAIRLVREGLPPAKLAR